MEAVSRVSLACGSSQSSSLSIRRISPEAALPPRLLNLLELFLLEGSGEVVCWPDGLDSQIVYQGILNFFSPMIDFSSSPPGVNLASVLDPTSGVLSNLAPITPRVPPLPVPSDFFLNLNDLLELHDFGESVVWPAGFDPISARNFVLDYRHAVSVCRLFRGQL